PARGLKSLGDPAFGRLEEVPERGQVAVHPFRTGDDLYIGGGGSREPGGLLHHLRGAAGGLFDLSDQVGDDVRVGQGVRPRHPGRQATGEGGRLGHSTTLYRLRTTRTKYWTVVT